MIDIRGICLILIPLFLAGCKPLERVFPAPAPCIPAGRATRASWLLECTAWELGKCAADGDGALRQCTAASTEIFCEETQ
jgi:hypothetical protein